MGQSFVSLRVMHHVHLFASSHRFASWDALRVHIDPRYTPEGDAQDSPFMQETGLTRFEPGCIEAIWAESGEPEALAQLLADSSYSAHWLPAALRLAERQGVSHADALICAFDPNELATPERSSLRYLGCLRFELPGTRLVD